MSRVIILDIICLLLIIPFDYTFDHTFDTMNSFFFKNNHSLFVQYNFFRPEKKQLTEVNFVHGDLTVEDWSHATMCFANSTCFDDPLMKRIADKAELMASGTFFITFTKKLPSEMWEVLEHESHRMSWGSATVYIQRKL